MGSKGIVRWREQQTFARHPCPGLQRKPARHRIPGVRAANVAQLRRSATVWGSESRGRPPPPTIAAWEARRYKVRCSGSPARNSRARRASQSRSMGVLVSALRNWPVAALKSILATVRKVFATALMFTANQPLGVALIISAHPAQRQYAIGCIAFDLIRMRRDEVRSESTARPAKACSQRGGAWRFRSRRSGAANVSTAVLPSTAKPQRCVQRQAVDQRLQVHRKALGEGRGDIRRQRGGSRNGAAVAKGTAASPQTQARRASAERERRVLEVEARRKLPNGATQRVKHRCKVFSLCLATVSWKQTSVPAWASTGRRCARLCSECATKACSVWRAKVAGLCARADALESQQ